MKRGGICGRSRPGGGGSSGTAETYGTRPDRSFVLVCVFVCVCERERERERESSDDSETTRQREREREMVDTMCQSVYL